MPEVVELPSALKTRDDVDIVGARWAALDTQLKAITQEQSLLEAKAVLVEASRRSDALALEIKQLREKYDPMIVKWARKQIGLVRAVSTAYLDVSFRTVNSTAVDVVDTAKGVAYIVKHCPEAIEYVPKVVKAKFTKAFLDNVSKLTKTALVRAGIAVKGPHDSITISLAKREV